MKNCDPLVSGPLLAMLTTPRVLCCEEGGSVVSKPFAKWTLLYTAL